MLAKLVQQYHLKIFFSNRYLHATILDKLTNKSVISAATNSERLTKALGEYASKNDERACTMVGRILAAAAKTKNVRKRTVSRSVCRLALNRRYEIAAQVSKIYWDGEVAQKTHKKDHRTKAELLWQSLASSDIPLARKVRSL